MLIFFPALAVPEGLPGINCGLMCVCVCLPPPRIGPSGDPKGNWAPPLP